MSTDSEKVLELIEKFLGKPIEKSEQPSTAEVRKALECVSDDYDLPDEVQSAFNVILKLAVGGERVVAKRAVDSWPSVQIAMPEHLIDAHVLQKMQEEEGGESQENHQQERELRQVEELHHQEDLQQERELHHQEDLQ